MAEQKKPAAPIIPDAFIASQAAAGAKLRDAQMNQPARFAGAERVEPYSPGQNLLLSALLGLQAGTKAAAQTSALQSPAVSLLAGLGAGAQVPGQIEEMRMQVVGNLPVEQVSPDLAAAYPELKGVPLSIVHKLSPLLSRMHGFEQQMAMMNARSDKNFAQQVALTNLRSSGADARNNVTPEEAKLYEKTYRIPAQIFEGMDKQIVNQQLIGFRPYQKQAEALLAAEKQVEVLKEKWQEISGDVGLFEGSGRKAMKGYFGKDNAKVAAYEDARQAAITMIRKLFNDSGAPSNFDVDRYLNAIPGVSTNRSRAENNWATLMQMQDSGKSSLAQASPMVEYIFQPLGAAPAAAAPAAAPIALAGDKARRLAELRAKAAAGGIR